MDERWGVCCFDWGVPGRRSLKGVEAEDDAENTLEDDDPPMGAEGGC